MKPFLLSILTYFTLILCITSLPQVPDFKITPTIFVKLIGPANNNNKETALQIFPINSNLNIEWISEGINEDSIVLIQAYYIFPTTPKETYVPLFKEPKESYLSEKSFKLKLDSDLFETDEKFYRITVILKSDKEVIGTSRPFGVCARCE